MRNIEGYVCVAETRYSNKFPQLFLFGESIGNRPKVYENLVTNDLTPYKIKTTAKKGKKELTKREDIIKVKLAKLEMKIAESLEEFDALKDSKSLAVIMIDDSINKKGDKHLYGPIVAGKPRQYPLPGALLIHNGFKTYDSLERAKYLAKEINRQAQCPIQIATFKLDFLE